MDDVGQPQSGGEGRQSKAPLIIGVGASAAALDSIERFFSKLRLNPDQAVVLVLQYRDAIEDTRLRGALQRSEGARLSEISDGQLVAGGVIHLCPSDMITTVHGDRFAVRRAEQARAERATIDSFLVSLAEERAEESIGVVLAGTGGDGTLGVGTLKDHGGLAIAERIGDGQSNPHDEGSSAAAIADFVLPPEDIPEHIDVYSRHLRRLEEKQGFDEVLAAAASSLARIADILRNKTGNDFHGYKQNTFLRRVQRRMQVVQIDDISAYVDFLRNDKDEAQHLFNDLLIGVTEFFRDKKEFEVLETQIIPKIFEGKGAGRQVRVWVLGCATGEEAYSIGILLREHMAGLDSVPQVQIFATDIDGRALAAARVGRYRTSIENDMTPERLARWFVREGDTYCVVKELREMCIFSQHNVIKDAPFSKLDLVSCRNLLIYLNGELQNRVIPLFHFALLPDRFLFLGNSENVTRHPKLFAPVDRRARIFKKLETGTRLPPEFPITTVTGRASVDIPPVRSVGPDVGLERRAQRIAERYAPAYVITDDHFHILHFSGRTGRYIEPTAGTATLDLLQLVHRDLRLELRTVLSRAAETNEAAHAEQLQLGVNGHRMLVDITVEPIQDGPAGHRNFVILFKDGPIRPVEQAENIPNILVRTEHVERLEGELRATRERLQATIEELESTNEELKSSNEEYQSLNEELQSANEELETSREELQSVNEELTTVNGELAHRVQELTRATSDLKNFLESTQIATVFLDNDLKVMNFTPAITHLLHLVETDVGRPIAHIKARIPIEELYDDVRRVLRTLASAERELTAPDSGTRYIVRILPYRSIDNFIAGVVITFIDVTAITRAEERQRLLLGELQHRVRNTLGVVRSIARRSAETSANVEDYASHLDGRLNAFARTQSLVTRDPEGGVDLEYLVVEELLAYNAREGEQLRVSGPGIRLQPKAAETFALALHELATNALKYGALSQRAGRIDVSWRIDDAAKPRQLVFNWRERSGPEVAPPRRRGFGSDLLERTLEFEFKGKSTLEFNPSGLHCTIAIPMSPQAIHTPSMGS
ncbi:MULTISPECIES: CheR family methyltransferase [Bradyrhizobium]|jgi:two-component system, chemotaxis family, CheB/CheR fusion protein|uniref:CheR family methyltransferase n=1 Tax=Bradyrhizobium TaxID=374 RepID=UPI0004877A6A|nr:MULTISPECIES: CheR family methyltransferase [Bradyrhizobium]MCS3449461.1 two-component system CheB/CheR fusion protein [Bradyrhizobium elkanii]MCS3559396.1 two-component system CheB/CheR fusion protein [Bradyrhizobium elkanii]MCW2150758.1 two-component system CheB/CheR fusion protein [Bradyrhizobium elkanii]MCW2359172.1 two-component system CheB/CheR fusion protein [Bradyrhizobium elkanii]MCW2374489.1 two-component system CheB/CheR fusion protein [Bradyrhizobium elkanii]